MATTDICEDDLDVLLEGNDIVLIDFWADWCAPCKSFAPVYEKISDDFPEIKFTKCDTQKEEQLAGMFDIKSIPTLAVFKEKILIFKQAGAFPEESMKELIEKVIELDMDEVRKELEEAEAEE